ncbi:hypothetical protein SEMRO_297_G110900.1 [Seminavis robusta]|uniref:Uncharacterized protein n=1 Tax=Seminavis robusta TaxID=568900 RepID=A0A9N8DQD9_9STRA|nr:hypothetical protein SEMRO_297_G110900.1 [Seminavis robusta]|eukprot:Sro297_g110900.1 n/a (174) ;mRNA; f:40904-41425
MSSIKFKKWSSTGGHPLVSGVSDCSKLERVRVFVSFLNSCKLLDVVRRVEKTFTFGKGDRTFECMWTHFCMELQFGDRFAILERTQDGVMFTERKIDSSSEVETWTGVPDDHVTFGQIMDFYEKELGSPYKFTSKNCKHFAYDFFRRIMRQQENLYFGKFCRGHEDVFRWKTS